MDQRLYDRLQNMTNEELKEFAKETLFKKMELKAIKEDIESGINTAVRVEEYIHNEINSRIRFDKWSNNADSKKLVEVLHLEDEK